MPLLLPNQSPGTPLLLRRVWLPRRLYAALPYLYLLLGALALVSGLFLPEPTWALPYLLLISVAGLHAGAGLIALRRRWRRPGREWENEPCDPPSPPPSATPSRS